MKTIVLFFTISFFCCSFANNIPVKGVVLEDKVLLRWAVSDVGMWLKAQQQGFTVGRFNGSTFDKKWTIFPCSINDTLAWVSLENDDAAMMIAQILSQEIDMHSDTLSYIMTMMACDRSFTAARMAGFGLTDTVSLNKINYVYKISLNGTELKGEWKSNRIKNIFDIEPLQVNTSDKKVDISFSTVKLNKIFSGYYFERATGRRGNFTRLNKVPFSLFGGDTLQTIYYHDTVSEYGKIYRYRVTGYDVFGDTAIVSNEISVKCVEEKKVNISNVIPATYKDTIPPVPPFLTSCNQDSNGVVHLAWKKSASKDVEGYRIFRSYITTENFRQITSHPVSDTFFSDTVSIKVHRKIFYFVRSIDSVGNESKRSNFSSAENPLPNIPAPALIEKCYATDKNVILVWNSSPDGDIKGYKIFIRKDSGEWQEATDVPMRDNSLDSAVFPISMFEKSAIYYFDVRACTERKNDCVSAPFFAKYISLSHDIKPDIEAIALRDKFCIVLQWKKKQVDNAKKIYIYRRTTAAGFTLVKTLFESDISQGAWNDRAIKIGNTYQYKIQIEFLDNTLSDYSKIINVQY
jgi:hypothetical protein